jgi:hypothetical protein
MRYIDTAFQQLEFAWKLYNFALEGHIDLDEIDKPLTFREGTSILALSDKLLHTQNDLVLACENNLGIVFGAAAITLNRCREEAHVSLADPIISEIDQFASLAYQIRNAFAHDIAEPHWNMNNQRFARAYQFGGIRVDLTNVGNKLFDYADIGGPEVLFWMKDYGQKFVWP